MGIDDLPELGLTWHSVPEQDSRPPSELLALWWPQEDGQLE